jgi:bifunctional DNA-binding transcriptional regulator/antitoxin component of YhaV-PrlF toxin-antitoxin module
MTSLQINSRGGLTLPKPMRKLLGVDRGGVVMIECQDGAITLRPAVAFPVELYDDQRIAEFDEQDRKLGQYLKKHRKMER